MAETRKLTEAQIDLARHALGLSGRSRVSYRNYFIIGEECPDHANWKDMVAAGNATSRPGGISYAGMDIFYLTHAGAVLALGPGESLCSEDFPETSDGG